MMVPELLAEELSRTWRWILIRGLAALGFALLAVVWPNLTLVTLALLLGAYALVSGAFEIAHACRLRRWFSRWWLVLCQGLLALAFGGLTLLWPQLTLTALVALAAAWSIVFGGLAVWFAFTVRRFLDGWWLPFLWGAASIGLGLLAVLWPDRTLVVVLWLLAAGAVLIGVGYLTAASRLRRLSRRIAQTPSLGVPHWPWGGRRSLA